MCGTFRALRYNLTFTDIKKDENDKLNTDPQNTE